MGRKIKIAPVQVRDYIIENQPCTAKEVGGFLNCCRDTIANKVKALRKDGDIILWDQEGYRIVTEDNPIDDVLGNMSYSNGRWTLAVVNGLGIIAHSIQPVIEEAVKLSVTEEERVKINKKITGAVRNLLDIQETIESIPHEDEHGN